MRDKAAGGPAGATPSLLYLPELDASGAVLDLPREEAHYVARVCRCRAGDLADATDGRGLLVRLRLLSVGPGVRAEVVSVERAKRRRRIWIWSGAPERGRADWLVEKLAELGVERFQPLECAGEPWPLGAARTERWKRLTVAALRQSRRAFMMEIRPPTGLEEAIGTIERPATCWVGDPTGTSAPGQVRDAALVVGAIGPSGGFGAPDLERLASAAFVPISLADGRLRTETAAIGLAAWLALPQSEAPGG